MLNRIKGGNIKTKNIFPFKNTANQKKVITVMKIKKADL